MQVKEHMLLDYNSLFDDTDSFYDVNFQRKVVGYARDLAEGVEEVLSIIEDDDIEEVIFLIADDLYNMYKDHELCGHVISAILKYWVYGKYVNKWILDRWDRWKTLNLEIEYNNIRNGK